MVGGLLFDAFAANNRKITFLKLKCLLYFV